MHRLTHFSLENPKITLTILGLVTLFLLAGLPRGRTEFGYRVLIGDDHPSIQALDALIAQFGGGLPVHIAWECGADKPCQTAFDDDSLRMADSVTRAFSAEPGVLRVLGPANAGLLVPTPDGFAVRRFVENGVRAAEANSLAERALRDPLWKGVFVSADGRVGRILVQATDNRSETDLGIVAALATILAPFEAQGFEFHTGGDAVDSVVPSRDLAQSSARLIPFTVLVIGSVLLLLSRSWAHTAVTLATMGLALLWTLGAMGWLNWPQDGLHEVLAPLILVVGVCDAIHLLSRYATELRSRGGAANTSDRVLQLNTVARDVAFPCLVTTLTTAAAFLSFTTSALDAFVRFGAIAAFGVVACLLLTFTLLPILAQWLPVSSPGAERATRAWEAALDAIVVTSARRAVPILVAATALSLFFGFGWYQYLRVDNDWTESWGESSPAVKSLRYLEQHFESSGSVELVVSLPPNTPLEDPGTLRTIASLSRSLSGIRDLGESTSVLDLMSPINRLLHNNDPAYERPGDTAAANAELLELIALDDASILSSWVSLDRSKLRVSTGSPLPSSSERERILSRVHEVIDSVVPETWDVRVSGAVAVSYAFMRDVQTTQLRSFPVAGAIAMILIAIFLGSLRLSLAAMVPAVLPVIVTLGAMGWLGLSLDIGRAMIAAVLIGIAVDDSIHVLGRYQLHRRAGESPQEAIRAAILHTGRAVVTTSLALSLGFLTLMASAWQSISSFGFFVALAILGALVASLFVLPALIFAFARSEGAGGPAGADGARG